MSLCDVTCDLAKDNVSRAECLAHCPFVNRKVDASGVRPLHLDLMAKFSSVVVRAALFKYRRIGRCHAADKRCWIRTQLELVCRDTPGLPTCRKQQLSQSCNLHLS